MSLSYFKQMVYSCLSASAMEAVEARFNVMQSVFIVMQSCTSPTQSEPSLDILTLSRNIFLTMYETYFNEKGEVSFLLCSSFTNSFNTTANHKLS